MFLFDARPKTKYVDIVAADFETYNGKKVHIKFTFPFPQMKQGTYNRTKEKLADEYSHLYQKTGSNDPIVNCLKLYLEDESEKELRRGMRQAMQNDSENKRQNI